MNNLEATWITTEDSFAAMADTWDQLAAATDPTSAFLLHDWFAAAWQWRRAGSSLAILCVRKTNVIVGILPMVTESRRQNGLPVRCLCALDLPDTQQFSLLCAADTAIEVAAAIAAELARTAAKRDLLQLSKMHGTPANLALKTELLKRQRTTAATADACLCAKLDEPWEVYYSRRSRRLKKGNNLIANRLKSNFKTVALERVPIDASAEGLKALEDLCALASASWKRDLPTALHRPEPRAWIDSLRRANDSEFLSAWCLRLDGTLVAAEIQLDYGGTIAALRADTHEDFDKHGVGTYLGWKVLENLTGRQYRLYNMGPGLNEYKERWAEIKEELTVATCYSSTPVGLSLWTLEQLKPVIRRITKLFARGKQP